MKLIFIHGREQENIAPAKLKADWVNALNLGLKKSNLILPESVKIEFPYYGDLLKKLTNKTHQNPNILKTSSKRSGGLSINKTKELEFLKDYLVEIAEEVAATSEEKALVEEAKKIQRGPLNWEITHRLLALLDKSQLIGEFALKRNTLDVFYYLSLSEFKRQINELVMQKFDDQPCVVVGHSLGSVVGYIILRDNPNLNVKKYVTLGSPLGSKTIRNLLRGTRMPSCIQNGSWFNAYDDRDVVALLPLDRIRFNVQPLIENKNKVDNHTKNRHGIEGYLDDPDVANEIYRAVVSQ